MREFEKNENLRIEYNLKEQEYINNTLDLFMIDEKILSKEIRDESQEEEKKTPPEFQSVKNELKNAYSNIKAKDEEIKNLKDEINKLTIANNMLENSLKERVDELNENNNEEQKLNGD